MRGSLGEYISSRRIHELEERVAELERENERLRLRLAVETPSVGAVQVDIEKLREHAVRTGLPIS